MAEVPRILRGHRWNVDFFSPIKLTEKQRETFLRFLRRTFAVVDSEEVTEFRGDRLGDKAFARDWTGRELAVLVQFKDNEQVCELLGRSWMSVQIKRGEFVPELLEWAHRKGLNITGKNARRLVEEFLKGRQLEVEERRKKRRQERRDVRQLEEKLEWLKQRRVTVGLMVDVGGASEPEVNRVNREIEETKRLLNRARRIQG